MVQLVSATKDKYIRPLMIDSQSNYIFSSCQDIYNCRPDKGWVTVAGIRCQLFKSTWFFFAKHRLNICPDNKRLIKSFAVSNTEHRMFRLKWNEIWTQNLGLSSNIYLSPRSTGLTCSLAISRWAKWKAPLTSKAKLTTNLILHLVKINRN